MLLVLLILLLLGIALFEAPRLVLNKLWRELFVFLLLWSFSSFLAVAQFMGVELPNPVELLSSVLKMK